MQERKRLKNNFFSNRENGELKKIEKEHNDKGSSTKVVDFATESKVSPEDVTVSSETGE